MASYIMNLHAETPFMNSYAWALKTYNKTGNINKPLSYYINEPHATAFNTSVSATIPRNPQVLFTAAFRQHFQNGTDAIIPVLQQNDLWNYKPFCKTILCHGQNDSYVPLFNTQQAYAYMQAQGADVTMVIYPGKDHGDCIWDYMATLYQAFEPLR
ncbi:MAG: prolyl oligopeptidase family serine peptidase [Chitinophagaceae bacterium]|nr:prolyl oligopeptidase family serine peptidase [Chitinophagaceae bacterium]